MWLSWRWVAQLGNPDFGVLSVRFVEAGYSIAGLLLKLEGFWANL